MHSLTCMSVVVCVVRKPRPCNSYSRRRDRINSVLWRSYYEGGGGGYLALIDVVRRMYLTWDQFDQVAPGTQMPGVPIGHYKDCSFSQIVRWVEPGFPSCQHMLCFLPLRLATSGYFGATSPSTKLKIFPQRLSILVLCATSLIRGPNGTLSSSARKAAL